MLCYKCINKEKNKPKECLIIRVTKGFYVKTTKIVSIHGSYYIKKKSNDQKGGYYIQFKTRIKNLTGLLKWRIDFLAAKFQIIAY